MAVEDALEGGFADAVFEAQAIFRAALDAMARPCREVPVRAAARPPAPLSPVAGALLLALADMDTPVHIDPVLAASGEVASWLRFHSGAPLAAGPGEAVFAVLAGPDGIGDLDRFAQGTPDYPDRSTTIIIQVAGQTSAATAFVARGPGIEDEAMLRIAGLDAGFLEAWQANGARFPRGVDVVFASSAGLVGLPRSTRLALPAAEGGT